MIPTSSSPLYAAQRRKLTATISMPPVLPNGGGSAFHVSLGPPNLQKSTTVEQDAEESEEEGEVNGDWNWREDAR